MQKLERKGFATDEIQQLLADLTAEGLLSDQRFAEMYIHARRQRGFGPKRISLELKAKGLCDEIIAHELNIPDNAWQFEIQRLWRKRFKGKRATNALEKMQQMRYLQYRGFTQDQILSVLQADD